MTALLDTLHGVLRLKSATQERERVCLEIIHMRYRLLVFRPRPDRWDELTRGTDLIIGPAHVASAASSF